MVHFALAFLTLVQPPTASEISIASIKQHLLSSTVLYPIPPQQTTVNPFLAIFFFESSAWPTHLPSLFPPLPSVLESLVGI